MGLGAVEEDGRPTSHGSMGSATRHVENSSEQRTELVMQTVRSDQSRSGQPADGIRISLGQKRGPIFDNSKPNLEFLGPTTPRNTGICLTLRLEGRMLTVQLTLKTSAYILLGSVVQLLLQRALTVLVWMMKIRT